MQCAAVSLRLNRSYALRTTSANAPPPGTTNREYRFAQTANFAAQRLQSVATAQAPAEFENSIQAHEELPPNCSASKCAADISCHLIDFVD